MEAIKGGVDERRTQCCAQSASVMKAGVCIIDILLVMAKVPTLYHFYGMILLRCHRSSKGESSSATPELRDHIRSLSLSLSHLGFPSPCESFHTIPPLSPCHLAFFFTHVLLYLDSALAAHSCIPPFTRVLSPGTAGVVRIGKRTVIHEPTQRSV